MELNITDGQVKKSRAGLDCGLYCLKFNESRFEIIAGNFPREHLKFSGMPAPAEMGEQFFANVTGIEIVILQEHLELGELRDEGGWIENEFGRGRFRFGFRETRDRRNDPAQCGFEGGEVGPCARSF